jgi:hypothetical protein
VQTSRRYERQPNAFQLPFLIRQSWYEEQRAEAVRLMHVHACTAENNNAPPPPKEGPFLKKKTKSSAATTEGKSPALGRLGLAKVTSARGIGIRNRQ